MAVSAWLSQDWDRWGKGLPFTQLIKCCVISTTGFWVLQQPDPINKLTEDGKHLHKALQIRALSHPLPHLILPMTWSGREGRLYFYLYSTKEENKTQWHKRHAHSHKQSEWKSKTRPQVSWFHTFCLSLISSLLVQQLCSSYLVSASPSLPNIYHCPQNLYMQEMRTLKFHKERKVAAKPWAHPHGPSVPAPSPLQNE